jgi:hypothetical protein
LRLDAGDSLDIGLEIANGTNHAWKITRAHHQRRGRTRSGERKAASARRRLDVITRRDGRLCFGGGYRARVGPIVVVVFASAAGHEQRAEEQHRT